ncbi:MAG TPA: amidohydrolase family protein [Thermodesulfobacteriota bacterium]
MSILVSGVSVFDGRSPRRRPGPVLVEGDRIAAVGPEAETRAASAERLDFGDLRDATLMPGLVDAHIHLAISGADQSEKADPDVLMGLRMAHHARINLEAGITTIRDIGAKNHIDVHFRRALERGYVPGPRMLIAGKPIIPTGGHCTYMGREVDGPAEARRAAREQIQAGVDWLKLMVTGGIMTHGTDPRTEQMLPDEVAAVVEVARAAGRPVAAHCQGGPAVRHVIEAGITSLEHGLWLTEADVDLMVRRGTYYVPACSSIHLIARGEPVPGNPTPPPPWSVAKARPATEAHRKSFALALAAGVKIVAGSDYLQAGLPYELELMVEWGMNPVDALRSATSVAAEMLGLPEIGAVEPGKIADLLVVEGNPCEDIGAVSRPAAVLQSGRIVIRHARAAGRDAGPAGRA